MLYAPLVYVFVQNDGSLLIKNNITEAYIYFKVKECFGAAVMLYISLHERAYIPKKLFFILFFFPFIQPPLFPRRQIRSNWTKNNYRIKHSPLRISYSTSSGPPRERKDAKKPMEQIS